MKNLKKTFLSIFTIAGRTRRGQIEIASENLEEGSQFVYDNVAYQVTRTIMEDVEYPVYVMVLDILGS